MSRRKDPTKEKEDRVVDDLLERADAYREKFKSMKKKNEELLKKLEKLVSPTEEKQNFIPGVKPRKQKSQTKSASPKKARKTSPKRKSPKAKKASPRGKSPQAKKASPKAKSPKAKKASPKRKSPKAKTNQKSPKPKQKAKKESKNQEAENKSQRGSGKRGRGRRGRGRGRGRSAKQESSVRPEGQPDKETEDLASPAGGKPRTPRRGQRGPILAAFEPGFYGTPDTPSKSPRANPRTNQGPRSPRRSYSRKRPQEELRDLYNMEKEHKIIEEYNKPEFQNAFFPYSYPADPFGVAHQYPCYAGMAPGNLLPHFRRDTIFDHFEEIRKQIFQTFKEKLLVHAEESHIKSTKAGNTLQVHLKHKIAYQNLVPCLNELKEKITGVFVGKYDDAVSQPGCQIYLRFRSRDEASIALQIVGKKYDIHCRFLTQIKS